MHRHLVCGLGVAVLLGSTASAQLGDLQPGQNFPNAAQMFGGNFSENIDIGDCDNDGDLDVIVGNGGDTGPEPNRIYINRGGLQGGALGTFQEQTSTRFAGVPNDTSRDIEFADIDNDGDLDIYVSNRGTVGDGGETSRFYINQGGVQGGTIGFYQEETNARWGTLVSVPLAKEIGAQDGQGPWRDYTCDCDFGDLDDDGDLDLFHSSYGPNINGADNSRVFLNDGNGVFDELWPWANPGADIATHTMDLDLADFDGDYDLDIFMSSRDSQARVYVNNCRDPLGDRMFTDITQFAMIDNGVIGGGANYESEFADLDADGDFDVWMKNFPSIDDTILRNNGPAPGQGFSFTMTSWIVGDPGVDENEVDFLDFDGDGDLDAFAANFGGTNWLYQSGIAQGYSAAQGFYHRTGTLISDAPQDELPTNGTNGQQSLDGECADMDNDGDEDILLANDAAQQNRYFENVLGVPDTHAPTIERFTEPCDKPEGTETLVHVQVRDNSSYYVIAYYDAVLKYSVDGGGEVAVDMFSQGGQQFRGVIPAVSGTVEYHVEVSDMAGNTVVSPTRSFVQSGTTYDNLGFALLGTYGSPTFFGTGTWAADTGGQLILGNARENATAGLFVGFTNDPTPFKGGQLVPVPPLPPFIFVTPGGPGPVGLNLPFVVPKGIPCGLDLFMQWVLQDPAGVAGFSLSNAVQVRTP